jgi:hypothetical protein
MKIFGKSLAFSILAVFCLYRLYVLISQPLPLTLGNFVDDAFYYLQIAQNMVVYGFPTFDGLSSTNGYQPLWQMLLMPLYILKPHAHLAIYYLVQVLQLLLFGYLGVMFYRFATRWGTPAAGLLAVLFLVQYFYWSLLLNGMETALNLLFLLTLFGILGDDKAFISQQGKIVRGRWMVGLMIALAVLARLDSIYYVFTIGLILLARWYYSEDSKRSGFVSTFLPVIIPPVVLVGGYLLINKMAFGNYLPISGLIKSHFPRVEPHPSFFIYYPWLTGLGLYGAFLIFKFVRNLARGKCQNLRWETSSFEIISVAFAAGYWLHAAWNALFMSWAVWDYYFVGVFVLIIPLGADLIKGLNWIGSRLRSTSISRAGFFSLAGLLFVLFLWGAVKSYQFRGIPFKVRTYGAADFLRQHTPPEAILAGTDCGILSYFSQRRTINLDGLVNDFQYQEYLRRDQFDVYLKEKGVDYLAIFDVPDSLFYGTYQTFTFSVWSNVNRCHLGNLPLQRDWEVYRSQVNPSDLHASTLIIVWQLPWSDQPLRCE